jgi:hypothetical protein
VKQHWFGEKLEIENTAHVIEIQFFVCGTHAVPSMWFIKERSLPGLKFLLRKMQETSLDSVPFTLCSLMYSPVENFGIFP